MSGYTIYRDGIEIGSSATPSYNDTNLAAQTLYSYTVVSYDSAGNVSAESSAVEVTTPEESFQLDLRISNGSNDVEQLESGEILFNSSDLELVDDLTGGGNQTVGLRFTGVDIPYGAYITNAYLEFETDEAYSGATSLVVRVEDSDDAIAFSQTVNNVSSRLYAVPEVLWDNVEAWSAVNGHHQTPDLSSLLQSVVDRAGWDVGGAIVFAISGEGLRTAESYEGESAAAPLLHVEYRMGERVNQAPVVNAGSDLAVGLFSSVTLSGSVTDDGLPSAGVQIDWQQLSGPGSALFTDPNSAITDVTFDTVGTYELELVVDDGEYLSSDSVTVTVTAPDTEAPSIPQNLSGIGLSGTEISLTWSPSSDNVGVSGYTIYRDGIEIGSSATPSYNDTNLAAQTLYSYTVVSYDSAGNVSAESSAVEVTTPEESFQLDLRISNGSNDVEQLESGEILFNSSDLELVDDLTGGGNQTVGLRFTGVDIPYGAYITNAYLEFETDEAYSGATSLVVRVEDSDDAIAFSQTVNNVSSRLYAVPEVLWDNVEAWSAVNGHHQTPDLSSLLQSVVDRAGWDVGGAIVFAISGEGLRTAESYEGESAAAPLLHVEYRMGVN
nr:hypothetical protein [uncultured Desulfuromusa sp.]